MPYCPICEKCLCKPVKIPHNEVSKKPENQPRKYKANFAKLEGHQFPNDAKYGGGIVSSKCGHLFHQNCLHEYITTFRTKGDCYGATYNVLCPLCGQNLCCGKMLKIDIEAHFGILEEFFQGLYKLKYMNKELKRTLETEWEEIAGLEKKIETSKEEYEHYKGMKRATEERCAQQEERITKAIEDANTCFRYREIEKQLLDENVNLEAVARRMEKIISTRHQPSDSSTSSSTTSITSDNENTEDAQITSYDSFEEPEVHSNHQVDISLQISVQSEWSSETADRVGESLQEIQNQEVNHTHSDNVKVRRLSSTQILCRARGVAASDLHHAEQWAIQQVSQEMLTFQDLTRNHGQAPRKLHGNANPQAADKKPTHNIVIKQVSQHLICRHELPKGQTMEPVNPSEYKDEHETKIGRRARAFASTAAGKSRSYTIQEFHKVQDPLKNVLESAAVALQSGPQEPKISLAKKRSYTIKVHGAPENKLEATDKKTTDIHDENKASICSSVTGVDFKSVKTSASTDLVDFLVVSCNESEEGKLPSAKPTLTDIHLEQVASKLEEIVEGKRSRIRAKRKPSTVDFRPYLFPPSPVEKSTIEGPVVDIPKSKKPQVIPESLNVQEFSINPGPRQRAVGAIKLEAKKIQNSPPASKIQLKPAEGVTFTVKVEPRPSQNSLKMEQNRKGPPRVKMEVKKPQALTKSTVETKTPQQKPLTMMKALPKMPPVPPKTEYKARNENRSPALDFSHLIVPPPPPLSHNSTVSALLVPPTPPMTPQDRAIHVSTPNSTRKFIESLLDTSDNLLSNSGPRHPPLTPFVPPPPVISSRDELIQIVPPPPALGLFSEDLDLESEDEFLKSVISQSTSTSLQVQTDSSSTVNETGAGDVVRCPLSKCHSSSSTSVKQIPNKCLAAQRFANAFRHSQSSLVDASGANIPAQSPRYVYYGHKADGIRQQDHSHTCFHQPAGAFQYENMPVTPIVVERNAGSGKGQAQQIMALSSSVFNGSHAGFRLRKSPQALSSLIAEQSCMDFYPNLNKKCFP